MRNRIFAVLLIAAAVTIPASADKVIFTTRWGYFWTAVGGGGGAVNASTRSSSYAAGNYEKFTLGDAECLMSNDTVTFRTSGGKFIGITSTGDLVATATSAGANEKFVIEATTSPVQPGGVVVKAANLKYVCAGSDGVLKASCTNGDANNSMSLALEGNITGTFTAKPVVNMGTPSKAGTTLTLTASTTGGVAGTSKYKWVVTDAVTNAIVKSSGALSGNYSYQWGDDPATATVEPGPAAGTYKITATVERYCQGVGPLYTAEGTIDHLVASATVARPDEAGTNDDGKINRDQLVTLTWTQTNLSGKGSIQFFDEATYSTRTISDNVDNIASGATTWTVPADLPFTTKGRIRITSYQNAGLSWDSPQFTVESGTIEPPATWGFTQRLTQRHFTEAGVVTDYTTKLNGTNYSISSILNSGTDRLIDSNKCSLCHDGSNSQSAGRYQPVLSVAKDTTHKPTRGGATKTGYRWDNASEAAETSTVAPGVVHMFKTTTNTPGGTKPADLEALFATWLAKGAP